MYDACARASFLSPHAVPSRFHDADPWDSALGMRVNRTCALLLQIRDKKVKAAGAVAARPPAAYSKSSR